MEQRDDRRDISVEIYSRLGYGMVSSSFLCIHDLTLVLCSVARTLVSNASTICQKGVKGWSINESYVHCFVSHSNFLIFRSTVPRALACWWVVGTLEPY